MRRPTLLARVPASGVFCDATAAAAKAMGEPARPGRRFAGRGGTIEAWRGHAANCSAAPGRPSDGRNGAGERRLFGLVGEIGCPQDGPAARQRQSFPVKPGVSLAPSPGVRRPPVCIRLRRPPPGSCVNLVKITELAYPEAKRRRCRPRAGRRATMPRHARRRLPESPLGRAA